MLRDYFHFFANIGEIIIARDLNPTKYQVLNTPIIIQKIFLNMLQTYISDIANNQFYDTYCYIFIVAWSVPHEPTEE